MKVRNGFVSNSSSSSFILGYGVVKDEQKLQKYLKDNKIEVSEVIDMDNNYNADVKLFHEYSLWEEDLYLNGGNCTDLKIPEKYVNSENKILVVQILNNEGDSTFYNETRDELDYDKSDYIDFYSTKQQQIIELLKDESIFENPELRFGAERNG